MKGTIAASISVWSLPQRAPVAQVADPWNGDGVEYDDAGNGNAQEPSF